MEGRSGLHGTCESSVVSLLNDAAIRGDRKNLHGVTREDLSATLKTSYSCKTGSAA